jgi:hypothetical protein
MRTFEGIMKIKWYENDNGDWRGLTIDTENKQTLNVELKRIRKLFMTEQDPESDEKRLAYNVAFEMNERK